MENINTVIDIHFNKTKCGWYHGGFTEITV